MSDVTEKVQEVVAEVAEEVAEQAVDFAEFARQLNKVKIQFGLFGAVVGAATAGLIAFKVAYVHAERRYSAIADDEIQQMAEHYHDKGLALEASKGKGDLADLVRDKGYVVEEEPTQSSGPPMAVQPPQAVVDAEEERAGEPPEPSEEEMAEDEVEGPAGVKTRGEDAVRNIFKDNPSTHVWDPVLERRRRSPDRPYVIHDDERHEMEGYSDISLTYYTKDDVLCDERDEVMDPARRDDTVGEANLDRFGHGSGDPHVVFIRNDNLEIIYEVVQSPNSYAEEVHGFTDGASIRHGGYDRGNLERMRRRERDEEH